MVQEDVQLEPSRRKNFFATPLNLKTPRRFSPLPPDESRNSSSIKLPMSVLLNQHRINNSSSSKSSTSISTSEDDLSLLPPVPESILLRDILYIFQGIDGQFIRFKSDDDDDGRPNRNFINRGEINSTENRGITDPPPPPTDGGGVLLENGIEFFELKKRGFSLPVTSRTLLHQLSELGWLYKKIQMVLIENNQNSQQSGGGGRQQRGVFGKGKRKATNTTTTTTKTKRRPIGMIEQSLHAELQKEMTNYFKLIARLEGKLERNNTLQEQEEEEEQEEAKEGIVSGELTLKKLDVSTLEMRLRLRMMVTLLEQVERTRTSSTSERAIGGAFLTILHGYTFNGDPFIRDFSTKLLKTLSVPFFSTLSSWIYQGELRDPFSEFFVELNPALEKQGDERWNRTSRGGGGGGDYHNDFELVDDERGVPSHELWGEKFSFRKEMLPRFLEETFGRKIFSTGKSLNFMKYSCQDNSWVIERSQDNHHRTSLEYADMASLERSISLAYSTASHRLFELFFDKFNLMQHLRALKDYLMLGKGDFCEILMEQLGPSLSRPANTLYRHNLTSTLETAIRGSLPPSSINSPESVSILRRLDARIVSDFQQGEVGWDVFLLEYKVEPPLSTILDPTSLSQYREMFKHLWRIKRVEYGLNECWRTLMTSSRLLTKSSIVSFALHQARTALSKMIFFVRQVEYYCHLEVIACQWAELEQFINSHHTHTHSSPSGGDNVVDLDKLIEAHKKYLTKMLEKTLLKIVSTSSKRSKQQHQHQQQKEQSLKNQLETIFVTMLAYKNAADDLFAHAMQLESHARSAQDTTRGVSTPSILSSRLLNPPSTERLYDIETLLISHSDRFQQLAESFVSQLEKSPDLDMKFLAVRLNFNFQFRAEPTGAKSEA